MTMPPKRWALVGTGSRGLSMFAKPLCKDLPGTAALVALCDVNGRRLANVAKLLGKDLPLFTTFYEMLQSVDFDGVAVATTDLAHAEYVVAALKANKLAVSEKPLCTTADECRQILAAARDSDASCLVTHNARYGAAEKMIYDLIRSGRLGEVKFMQFDETLDRCHGADYFRRWHGKRANSGGLLIHKASHHFDQLNWWAGAIPVWVSAQGSLQFYGANGPFHYIRCQGCPHADPCDFHSDMFKVEIYRKLYLEAESEDGYFRDGCVFDPAIDVDDQAAVLIRYDNGVEVSYTLTAYSPIESQRVIVEGTEGRLEYSNWINTGWVIDSEPLPGIEEIANEQLRLILPAVGIEDVPIERVEGSHGGADPQLRADFFGTDWAVEPNAQMASLEEAVQAVLVGVAANKSIATGEAVHVQQLLVDD